jgi:hypothetical protein
VGLAFEWTFSEDAINRRAADLERSSNFRGAKALGLQLAHPFSANFRPIEVSRQMPSHLLSVTITCYGLAHPCDIQTPRCDLLRSFRA